MKEKDPVETFAAGDLIAAKLVTKIIHSELKPKELTEEEMYKIFADHHDQIIKDQMKQDEKDNQVIDIVKKKVSEKYFKLILEEMKESECAGHFEIVKEPEGEKQTEEYEGEEIDVWVDQTIDGGYVGDEYAGFAYVKLNEKEYLKWYYAM